MTGIEISDELDERLRARVEDTGFRDVDAYSEFVLSEVLDRVESDTEDVSDIADEDSIESRLQSLGYLE